MFSILASQYPVEAKACAESTEEPFEKLRVSKTPGRHTSENTQALPGEFDDSIDRLDVPVETKKQQKHIC